MRDVARRAGVSPVVVSRVLHNKALTVGVSDSTAIRVRQAAEDLGYRRNVAAVNFRQQQTLTIGLLNGIGSPMPTLEGGTKYLAALMDGIIGGSFRQGFSVLLCPTLLGKKPDDALNDGRCDGLILYNLQQNERNAEMLRSCTLPVVLVHNRGRDFGCDIPSVVCDNFQGIGLAFDHLVGLGHRKIAYAEVSLRGNPEILSRREAFLSNCRLRGLPLDEGDVVNYGEFRRIYTGGYTAAICLHDGLAGMLMEEAAAYGLRVPQDLSVVGFDSTSYCHQLEPELTSVNQPLTKMGEHAVELLLANLRGDTTIQPEATFPCSLDVRASTAPI